MIDETYTSILPEDAYPSDKEGPTFKAHLTVIVRDANRNIINIHKQWSRSPTANFFAIFLPNTDYNGPPITNTGGSTYNYYTGTFPMYYPNTDVNNQSYLVGIQVGNGKQTNPYSAYTLASPIANGSGSGQLQYGQPSVSSSPIVSGNSVSFYISQTFINNSGGTVTISEVGVIITMTLIISGNIVNIGNVLVWYDALSSSISVPNGGSVTIYYTFTVNP
jgi:hypothetical protein